MKTIKKDECSYSVSNAIRTLAMVRKMGLEPKLLRFTVEISCTKAITAVFSLY